MLRPPWNRQWLEVTPDQFEKMVVKFLRGLGKGLKSFSIEHQVAADTPVGEFAMDAIARFEALGTEFVVLVECKHHKNPIKRELVQVLADKLLQANAQKAILFSTASFQTGAIEYAKGRGIALVHFTEGGPIYETRSQFGSVEPRRPYDAYVVSSSENGSLRYASSASKEFENFPFGCHGAD